MKAYVIEERSVLRLTLVILCIILISTIPSIIRAQASPPPWEAHTFVTWDSALGYLNTLPPAVADNAKVITIPSGRMIGIVSSPYIVIHRKVTR